MPLAFWKSVDVLFLAIRVWWIQNKTIEDRSHLQTSSSEDVHYHLPQNWSWHPHPSTNPKSEDSYLKHLNHCCLLISQNRHAKSTTFDLLSLPKWWIYSHFYQWRNPTKQHDNFSNDNACNPRKQTCPTTLYFHLLLFVSPNLFMSVASRIWVQKLPWSLSQRTWNIHVMCFLQSFNIHRMHQ